ncbi:MAG: thiamine phosphate synthase [Alphaproteobacteria bacterium]
MASSLSDVARHLNLTRRDSRPAEAPRPAALPSLILMTDARRAHDPVADVLRLPQGAAVIYRHYELMPQARLALARVLRDATKARKVKLLIADDMRLALDVRADGLHFSEPALKRAGTRLRKLPHWLVTAAAHSLPALRRAAKAGVTAALLSPVFVTMSHPGATPLGALRFAAMVQSGGLPVYGLGGINDRNARRLRGSGAAGVAAIDGLSRRRIEAPVIEYGDFRSLG